MSKLAANVACAVAGITLGLLVAFAIIGVRAVAIGPKGMCTLATAATTQPEHHNHAITRP